MQQRKVSSKNLLVWNTVQQVSKAKDTGVLLWFHRNAHQLEILWVDSDRKRKSVHGFAWESVDAVIEKDL